MIFAVLDRLSADADASASAGRPLQRCNTFGMGLADEIFKILTSVFRFYSFLYYVFRFI